MLRRIDPANDRAASAIEIDPAFASIRRHAEYNGLLGAAHACRSRFLEHVTARGHVS